MKSLALLALVPLLAGCLSCHPIIEVRNCLPDQCVPSDDAVQLTWTAENAADWPEVDALLQKAQLSEHEHMDWSEDKEVAFWADFNVSGDEPELLISYEDATYRVRILTCA